MTTKLKTSFAPACAGTERCGLLGPGHGDPYPHTPRDPSRQAGDPYPHARSTAEHPYPTRRLTLSQWAPQERLATQTPEMGLGDAGSFGTPVGTPESTPLPSGAPRCRS